MIAALDPIAVDLLLNLLPTPLTEMDLIETTAGVTQPTGHRRVRQLADAGIVSQHVDATGRGQPWAISTPSELEALLNALFDLVDALENKDRQERASGRGIMRRGRRGRLQLAG